jgi:hypothetical protein
MFSFLGRGVFYLFVGCIIMGDNWWKYAAGSIVALIGVAYIGLEFVPSIEPPANMRYVYALAERTNTSIEGRGVLTMVFQGCGCWVGC